MNCYFKGVFCSLSFYLTQVKSWKERPINVWKVKNKTLTEKEHKNLKYVPWYHLWPLSMSPTILEVGQPHRPMVFLVTNRSQQDSCWSIGILNLYSIPITFYNIVLVSYYWIFLITYMYQAKVCTTDDSECTLLPGLTNSPLGTCQVHQQVSQNFLHVRIHLHKSKCWIIETNKELIQVLHQQGWSNRMSAYCDRYQCL